MSVIEVVAHYPWSRDVVWAELSQIERHVRWMSDAVSIDFETPQRHGVGTSFRCTTKIGPFVTNDLMTISQWDETATMGVVHSGLIQGEGTFSLVETENGTTLTWREQLFFPWWAFGPLGAFVATPVLGRLWSKNLRQLGEVLAQNGAPTH